MKWLLGLAALSLLYPAYWGTLACYRAAVIYQASGILEGALQGQESRPDCDIYSEMLGHIIYHQPWVRSIFNATPKEMHWQFIAKLASIQEKPSEGWFGGDPVFVGLEEWRISVAEQVFHAIITNNFPPRGLDLLDPATRQVVDLFLSTYVDKVEKLFAENMDVALQTTIDNINNSCPPIDNNTTPIDNNSCPPIDNNSCPPIDNNSCPPIDNNTTPIEVSPEVGQLDPLLRGKIDAILEKYVGEAAEKTVASAAEPLVQPLGELASIASSHSSSILFLVGLMLGVAAFHYYHSRKKK